MKLIQFIYNDNVIAQQNSDMFLNKIDELKWILADVYNCYPDEIEARYVTLETNREMSEYDLTDKGIVCCSSGYQKTVNGILCDISENSNEFIDAMLGKNVDEFIEKHLHFKF
jgi:hypothetical protein